MIIEKLHIKNINSLKGEFTIDFTDKAFKQSPIFAITGDIGAGKSSILDAICLALYNETPRVGSTSDTVLNQGQICTIGTNESYAKIVFSNNGLRYRSSWMVETVSRGDNEGQWKSPKVDLEIWENEKFNSLPDASKKSVHSTLISDKIGLNFNQFEKTILLAQGSFAEMLKAKEEERTEIVEKLTGTEEYRKIGQKVFYHHKSKKDEITALETELSNKGEQLLSKDALQELSKSIEANKALLLSKTTEQAALFQKIERLKSYGKHKHNLHQLKQEQEKLLANKAAIETLKTAIARSEDANKLQPEILAIRNEENNVSRATKTIDELNTKLRVAVEEKTEYLNSILVDFPELAAKKTSEEILEKQIPSYLHNIILQKTELEKVEDILDASQKDFKRVNTEINEIRQQIEQNTIALNKEISLKENSSNFLNNNSLAHSEGTKILNTLQDIDIKANNIFDNYSALCQRIKIEAAYDVLKNYDDKKAYLNAFNFDSNLIKQAHSIQASLQKDKTAHFELRNAWDTEILKVTELNNQLEAIKTCNKELSEKNKLVETLTAEGLEISSKIKSLEADLKQSEQAFSALNLSSEQSVKQLRSQLQDNKPCMVCGSSNHPFVVEGNDMLKTFAEQKIKELDWQNQIKALEISIQNKREDLSAVKAEIKLLTNNITQHQNKVGVTKTELKFTDFLNEKIDLNTLKIAQQKAIEGMEKTIEQTSKKLEALNDYATFKYAENLSELKAEKKVLEQTVIEKTELKQMNQQSLQGYLTTLIEKDSQNKNAVKNIAVLRKNIEDFNQRLKKNNDYLEGIKKQITKIEGDKNTLNQSIKNKYTAYLNPYDYKEQFVSTIAKRNNLVSTTHTAIADKKAESKSFAEQLKLAEEAFKTKASKLNFSNTTEVIAAMLSDEVGLEYKQKIDDYNTKSIGIKSNINSEEKALNAIGNIEQVELNALPELQEKLNDLNDDITQENKAQGRYLEQLNNHKKLESNLGELNKNIEEKRLAFIPIYLLNQAIGDKEGKRFAIIAARFTFNQLLAFANYHLNNLKSRYTFKILDVLDDNKQDLVIIDRDMGNVERPAKSTLSGGETFLTSLCLALALSDLSANKVQIKSLFIDEGFGSLDQNSLNDAISLLENLPDATGKNIGIISHVEALKQRIETQITLKKLGSGFSKIILPV